MMLTGSPSNKMKKGVWVQGNGKSIELQYNYVMIKLVIIGCRSQKFEDPAEGEAALVAKFSKLHEDLTAGFRALEDETR